MKLLEVRNISFSYPGRKTEALKNVSFSLERGGYTAILGANGSGKSTLARIVCGFLEIQHGAVNVEKDSLTGIVFQSPKEQIVCSVVKRDTAFGPQNLSVGPDEVELRTIESLAATGLLDRIDSRTTALSLGQTQKLAFSGILALHPDLLVLDEVTAMLDPDSRQELLFFIDEWNKRGHAVLHITHSYDEALRAGNVIVLDDGKIVFSGSGHEFALDTELVGKIFGGPLPEAEVQPDKRSGSAAFCAENIYFSYGDREVLRGASFELAAGSLTAVTGPSGCGKSTLLEVGAGLLQNSAGKIRAISRPALARQDSAAALFERFAADDVAFGPRNRGIRGRELISSVKKAMDMVSLPFDEFADRQTFLLSGGEQRKLSLAGIIAMNPAVMFFDEPTAGLDPAGQKKVMLTLKELCRQGKTVVFTTHRKAEASFADRELIMREGKVFASDNRTAAVRSREQSEILPEFKPYEGAALLTSLRRIGTELGAADNSKTGFIGKFHPVIKYLLFFCLFIPSLAAKPAAVSTAVFLVTLLYAAAARYPAKRLAVSLLKVLPWLVFFCIFQIVFFPAKPGEKIYIPYRFFLLTPSKIMLCIETVLHTAAAFACISAFVYSTPEHEVIDGFSGLLKPLSWCRIPVRSAVVILEIIFRFIPLLIDEASSIIKTQLVRGGLGAAQNMRAKIKVLLPLFVPLMIQTIKRSESLADALTARYFR
jgi:energy-coupling factor transport system ATP-binding protein